MTNLWSIRAKLEFDGDVRRIHYKIDRAQECAYPTLGTIFFWCKDACEELLSELKEKKADKREVEYVEKEIEFLNGNQIDWGAKHKEW